jgi:pimeloyl-ACP methyl ester carboxylesterase
MKNLIGRKKIFKRAEKFVPKLTSYEIPDCGHFSIGDQPEKIAAIMLEFLNNKN